MALSVEDQLDIQQLYARYNHAIDFGDAAGWAACFTPDGVFESGPGAPKIGSEALTGFATAFAARMQGKARHWNTNIVLEDTASGARGKCYLMLLSMAEKPATAAVTAVYHDELVKTADGWKFSSRKVQGD